MLTLSRTHSGNQDFVSLVKLLDADLAVKDGEDHAFYSQYNKLDQIKYVIVAYTGTLAVGCGAIKQFTSDTVEIKRMFVLPEKRGQGIAQSVLQELELWAGELGFEKCILETGKRQPDAIALYKKSGYHQIANYGQYAGVEYSVCFGKKIQTHY